MYMNVNGILADQRPGAVWPVCLAALRARLLRRPPAARGAVGAGLSRLLARASRAHPRAMGSGLRGLLPAAAAVPGRFMSDRHRWGGPGSAHRRCQIPA
jgi:hypothetical protein